MADSTSGCVQAISIRSPSMKTMSSTSSVVVLPMGVARTAPYINPMPAPAAREGGDLTSYRGRHEPKSSHPHARVWACRTLPLTHMPSMARSIGALEPPWRLTLGQTAPCSGSPWGLAARRIGPNRRRRGGHGIAAPIMAHSAAKVGAAIAPAGCCCGGRRRAARPPPRRSAIPGSRSCRDGDDPSPCCHSQGPDSAPHAVDDRRQAAHERPKGGEPPAPAAVAAFATARRPRPCRAHSGRTSIA